MATPVQRIACSNAAAFVMSFNIKAIGVNDDGGDAFVGDSGTYPIDQTRSLDLSTLGIPVGALVVPHVSAVLGTNNEGDKKCIYQPNGQTATYNVTGTTLFFSVAKV